MYLSKILLMGYVGRDAGKPFKDSPDTITFPLAVNTSWKDNNGDWQSKANWYEIMTKNEDMLTKIKKGMHLYVEGTPKVYAYKNNDTGEAKARISVNLITYRIINKPDENQQQAAISTEPQKHYETVGETKYALTTPPAAKRHDLDDDIPF